MGEVAVVAFAVLKVPDYETAMLIYLYICIRTHDTRRSFEPICTKFTWFVRVHSWVNPIIFGNNRPYRTTYMEENVPPKPVFRVYVRRCGVF